MELSYFNVVCEEVDVFDGKIIHINEKAKNTEEICQIIKENLNDFPTSHWELHPCFCKV